MNKMKQVQKIAFKLLMGSLAFLIVGASIKLDGITIMKANVVTSNPTRDVTREQPETELVEHEPNNAVPQPDTPTPKAQTTTKSGTNVQTTTPEDQLVEQGYQENREARTLTSKTYDKGGESQTIVYMHNVHYEVDGQFVPYDSTLEAVPSHPFARQTPGFRVKQSDADIFIPKVVNAQNPMTVTTEDQTIAMTLPDYTLSNPTLLENKASYVVDENISVDIAAIDTTIKTMQTFASAIPDTLTYQFSVPTGFSLHATPDNTSIFMQADASQTIVDYLPTPIVYDAQGHAFLEHMELTLEQLDATTYHLKLSPNISLYSTPPSYPLVIDVRDITLGGFGKDGSNDGVVVYGMNVINGDTTYGPNYNVFPDFFMLGYVMDPLYYPSGAYQGVANVAGLDIKSLLGNNREITGATFNMLEFTAENSSFADSAININMSLIEKDYPGRPHDVTWNSWHQSAPQYSVIDTQAVSKYHNNFASFNIQKAIETWYYSPEDRNFGLHLAAERQGEGLLFSNHDVGNAFLNSSIWGGLQDGRPYITINHKTLEPIPDDYGLDDTIVNLRPFTSYDREGVLQFQTLGFDGIATPGSQVDIEVYDVKTQAVIHTDTSNAPNGFRVYPFYEEPLYPKIPQAQSYYGRTSNWQAANRLSTNDLQKDTEYGVRVRAQRLNNQGEVIETGAWVEGDTFQIYRASGFDRVPRIMNFYGLTDRNSFMYDNHMQDELIFEQNEVFVRNPSRNQGIAYMPDDLSEEDKKLIDFSLIGRGKHCEFGYEPINLNTGNFYYTNEDASWFDYTIGNTLTRSYNSLGGSTESIFGRNWSFNWDQQLTFLKSGSAVYQDGTGRRLIFTTEADGSYTAPAGEQLTLTKEIVGEMDYTEDVDYYDGVTEKPITTTTTLPVYEFVLRTKQDASYHFSVDGYLKEAITNQDGHTMQFVYDDQKFLQQIITPSQKTIDFTYNSAGYVESITQPDGHVLTYGYDTLGNLTTFTDASGYTLTYTYTDPNQPYLMTSYLDRAQGDAVITNTYDAMGRVVKQVDAKGDTAQFAYFDNHTTITSFDGSKEYVYIDDQKRTTKHIATDGTETTYTYDANNNLATRDDGQHAQDQYTFDERGNLLTETRADGKVKTYTYDAENNPITVTNFDGTETTFTYDAQHNLITVAYIDGTTLQYGYNEHGQKTTEIDATGNVITYTYDAAGNCIQTTDSFGTKTTTYDAMSLITTETDALGNESRYVRNARGELIEHHTPKGIKTYTYDADGQKIYETDANNNPKSYTYDAWSRVIAETDSYGTKSYTYDAFGNKLTSTDELGYTTTYSYDAAHRVVKTVNPDGSHTSNTYDEHGNLATTTDVLGNTTSYQYDTLGRKVKDIDPKGRETVYSYDVLGNLISTTYPDGLMETNTYNALNQLISSTDKKGNSTTYTYDMNGNTIETNINDERVTKTHIGVANTVTAEIDELGNSTEKLYNAIKLADTVTMRNGLTYTYDYDGAYNIIKVTDNLGNSTTRAYDGNRNLLTETDELGNVTTHTYTARNQPATTVYPDGGVVQHVYDAKGQEIQTIDQLGFSTYTTYDNMGRSIETIDANGGVTKQHYNKKGQLIETTDPLGQTSTTTYDQYGLQVETIDVTNKKTTYTYDDFDRQVAQQDSNGVENFTTYNQYGETIETVNEQGHRTATTYDQYGQVIATTDLRGNTDTTVYDALGRVIETLDAKGNQVTTSYNGIGQKVLETTQSDNGEIVTESYYNAQGLLDRQRTNGEETTYTYDAKNQLLSLTLPTGATTTYTYTFDGKEASVTDANGGVTQSVYDKKGQLIQTIDPLGNVSQTIYDGNGNAIERIDPLGQSETIVYDALNRVIKQTDKKGNITTTTYNKWNQPQKITMPNQITREYTYDDQGREIATKNVPCETCSTTQGNAQYTTYDAFSRKAIVRFDNGYETYYHYTPAGDIAEITNNLGETIEANSYDAYGRLIEKADANNNKTTYIYNNKDQIVQTTAANGNSISYTYNEQDKMATMQDIRGNTTTYQYDAIGNLLAMQLPGSREYSYTYDLNSNIIQDVDANGAATTYTYDLNNQVIQTTNALGQTHSTTYTATGDVATQTNARGNTLTYQYDANGNNTVILDELGNQTTYSYDENNRLSLVKNRNGHVSAYGYDSHNNHIYTIDAKGNMVNLSYDKMNNLREVKTPDGSKATYSYDTKGNKVTEQKQDRRTITYRYDALNNQVYKGFDDKQYTFTYNSENQMTEMHDGQTGSIFTYNQVGDLLQYTDAFGNAVQYTYDELGRRSGIIYPDGKHVTYTYDNNDNLLTVQDGDNKTTYTYDAINRLTQTDLPNNMRTTYTYDENGNTTQLQTIDMTTQAIITNMQYTYDTRDLVTHEVTNIEGVETVKTYSYDAEEQLIQTVHERNGKQITYDYQYDVNGNKIVSTETIDGKVTHRQFDFDSANKLVQESGEFEVAYRYNSAGHVTEKQHKTTGLIEHFAYNAEGQLIQVENNEGKLITYSYDGLGNRTQKVEATTLTPDNRDAYLSVKQKDDSFNPDYDIELDKQVSQEKLQNLRDTMADFITTYNQACPVVETDETKTSRMVLNYVNDINASYTEVLQVQSNNYQPLYTYTYGVQRLTNEKHNDATTYYQYDGKGSVIGQQTKNDGALRFKIEYNDYGKPNRKADNEFGYNAEAHDYHGSQYLRSRYYNTDTGRFDQQDSYRGEKEHTISQNRYTYVWNSPNQYIDKSGEKPAKSKGSSHGPGVQKSGSRSLPKSKRDAKKASDSNSNGGAKNKEPKDLSSSFGDKLAESRAREEAERERKAMDEEANRIQQELEAERINLDGFDLDSMSVEERLQLLRQIKKICEDYGLGTKEWDKAGAQAAVDRLVSNSKSKEASKEVGVDWLTYLSALIVKHIMDLIDPLMQALDTISTWLDFLQVFVFEGALTAGGALIVGKVVFEYWSAGVPIYAVTDLAMVAPIGMDATFLSAMTTLNRFIPIINLILTFFSELMSGASLERAVITAIIPFLISFIVTEVAGPVVGAFVNPLIGAIVPEILSWVLDQINFK